MTSLSAILITNDDGYSAPGLRTLWDCASALEGFRPKVAAPARGWSVRSHATMVHADEAIRVTPLDLDGMEGVIVDGFPADCVRVALRGLDWLEDGCPLVLSGINSGGNLGVDAYYSGTLAAAREAAILGCSAIALSVLFSRTEPTDWRRVERWALAVLRELAPLAQANCPSLWNVNFPAPQLSDELPPIRFVPMSTDPLAVSYNGHREESDSLVYNGPYRDRFARPGTDVEALFSGAITITPMRLDLTDSTLLEQARSEFSVGMELVPSERALSSHA